MTKLNPSSSPSGPPLLSGPPTLTDIHQIFTLKWVTRIYFYYCFLERRQLRLHALDQLFKFFSRPKVLKSAICFGYLSLDWILATKPHDLSTLAYKDKYLKQYKATWLCTAFDSFNCSANQILDFL